MSLSVKIVSSRRSASRTSAPIGRLVVEREQAFVVVGELELARRAQHAAALDAADLADLDPERLARALLRRRQLGADQRARRLHAGAHVGRAADDGERLGRADVDLADAQAIGVRVRRDRQHLGDDDAAERRRDRAQVLDLEPGHRQPLGELGRADRRIAELAQPGFGELHVDGRPPGSQGRPRPSGGSERSERGALMRTGAGSAGRRRRRGAGRRCRSAASPGGRSRSRRRSR